MKEKEIKKIEENGIVVTITERKYENGVTNYQVHGTRIIVPAANGKNQQSTDSYSYADNLDAAENKALSMIDTFHRETEGTGKVWDERLHKLVKAD